MTAQDIDLVPFTNDDSKKLRDTIDLLNIQPTMKVCLSVYLHRIHSVYFKQDSANAFLRDFNPDDIRCVNLFATSVDLWQISQPIRDIVVNNLRSNVTVPVRFSYTITRNPPNQDSSGDIAAVVTGEHTVDITAENQTIRHELIELLNGTVDSQTNTYDIKNYEKKFIFLFLEILQL